MAERRMISKKIICSDLFMDMPHAAQAFYFHLIQMADDDGFVGNPKSIQRALRVSDDDFRILIAKRFLYLFQSGVVVILHWGIHNSVRKKLYTKTQFLEEYEFLIHETSINYIPNCYKNNNYSPREEEEREIKINNIRTHYITDQGENGNGPENEISVDKPVDKCDNVGKPVENHVDNGCDVENNIEIQYDIPTLQDVIDFIRENQFLVDPVRFFDYYEKRGWKMANGDPIAWRLKIVKWDSDEKGERRFEKSGKRSGIC